MNGQEVYEAIAEFQQSPAWQDSPIGKCRGGECPMDSSAEEIDGWIDGTGQNADGVERTSPEEIAEMWVIEHGFDKGDENYDIAYGLILPVVESVGEPIKPMEVVEVPIETEVAPLFNNMEELYFSGTRVLMLAPHGVGKSYAVLEMAEKLGIKLAYLSCSTLDPYTDLIGVPVPTETEFGRRLEMVRPARFDEAELIFLDELNRAPEQVTNAVLEITQFGTLNGQKLPNLKNVWAAANPPEDVYDVNRIDAALMDRFNLYVTIDPNPSVAWLSQHMQRATATALVQWWQKQHASFLTSEPRDWTKYISPRRLQYAGENWERFRSAEMLVQSLPLRSDKTEWPWHSLVMKLTGDTGDGFGGDLDPFLQDMSEKPWKQQRAILRENVEKVLDLLGSKAELHNHKQVARIIAHGSVGRGKLFLTGKSQGEADILNAIVPEVLADLFMGNSANSWPAHKVSGLRSAFRELIVKNPERARQLRGLGQALDMGKNGPGLVPGWDA